MKLLVVLAAVTAICAGNAIPVIPGDKEFVPTIPGDNSHYVEGESRYIWMPDGEGVPHLVDLQAPVDEDFLNERNGANNQYWLLTRQNPVVHQVLVNGNPSSILNSNYRPTRPTKLLAHGWTSNANAMFATAAAFLANQDCNVILVDYRGVAGQLYPTAVLGAPSVGRFAGDFLQWVFNIAGGNWNNVHMVGMSLGAHVVGNAGRQVNGAPSRVTGLDPAGPLWNINSNALSRNSGQYVEGIHTDGGGLGIFNPIGHGDFYPNGGRNRQPGCLTSMCSHIRAQLLFDSTIRNNHLVGRLCTNINQAQNVQCTGSPLNMGNAILTKRGSGLYGLTTGSSYPY